MKNSFRDFFDELGISTRLNSLLQNCKTSEERESLKHGYRMIMDPDCMGTSFKVLSVFPQTLEKIIEKRGGAPTGFVSSVNTEPRE